MNIKIEDVYSFDNTAILNQCELVIPTAFRFLCGGIERLSRDTCKKLLNLCRELDKKNIPKYRFEPVNLERLVIKFGNDILIEKVGNIRILGDVFREKIIDQLMNFMLSVKDSFSIINKDEEINHIVKMFQENKRELHKDNNIPENEDCEILSGLKRFESTGTKYLISMDEHFWGYKDVIFDILGIKVIEEWNCHSLI